MTETKRKTRLHILFLSLVSFTGLFLTVAFAAFPQTSQQDFAWRKPLTGFAFTSICILGMTAVFFPHKCSEMFSQKKADNFFHQIVDLPEKENFRKFSYVFGLKLVHGHHPFCDGFAYHEFHVGTKSFCVACMGLFFGASFALPTAAIYFFSEWNVENLILPFLVLGVFGVASGLLQYLFFEPKRRSIRFALNSFFVFASSLLLMTVDTAAKSLFLNLFVVGFIVFWLYTRIIFSKIRHLKICEDCGFKCNQ